MIGLGWGGVGWDGIGCDYIILYYVILCYIGLDGMGWMDGWSDGSIRRPRTAASIIRQVIPNHYRFKTILLINDNNDDIDKHN